METLYRLQGSKVYYKDKNEVYTEAIQGVGVLSSTLSTEQQKRCDRYQSNGQPITQKEWEAGRQHA